MKRNWYFISLALICVLALWFSSVYAEETTVTLTDYAVIEPDGQSEPARVLSKVTLPGGLSGKQIDFAQLSFTITSLPGPYLEIEVYPLTTSWESRSVSWTSPWQNAGGDFDYGDVALVAITGGESLRGHADITDIVRSWIEGRRTNDGIILVCSEEFPGDFQLELGNQQAPVDVEIKYSDTE